jgi:hypothetical protein
MPWSLLAPFQAMYRWLLNTASAGRLLAPTPGTLRGALQLVRSKLLQWMPWSLLAPFQAMYKWLPNVASAGP